MSGSGPRADFALSTARPLLAPRAAAGADIERQRALYFSERRAFLFGPAKDERMVHEL